MENIKKLFIEDIENMFAFNLTNSEKAVEFDFGQYKLHRLYKPLINLYIKEFFENLENNIEDEKDREKILNIFIDFFSLYYNNWDFGYFKSKFNNYQYRVPYSGKDTEFFWATKDCYYVKTSDVVNEMQLDSMFDNEKLKLKFSKKVKASWEKQDKYDFSVEVKELFDEEWEKLWYEIIFYNWEESKWNQASKKKQIKEVLKEYNIDYENNLWLKKAIDEFLKKWWRDYFIHKRLKNFLLEELEWYFFQVLKNDTENKVKILELQNKIKLLKEKYQDDKDYLSFQIWKLLKEFVKETEDRSLNVYETAYIWIVNFINILSDLEELKKTLWLKPRKIKKQEYVITLWKLSEYIKNFTNEYFENIDTEQFHKDIFEEILRNEKQKQEWIELGMIDEKVENIFNMLGEIEDKYKNLPIDTKFFEKDSKLYEFLNKLWDSKLYEEDCKLDGLLIKSENFQALNTLWKDYAWTIKTIYIDPPYNTWNDDFVYKDNYNHSSWLSMMENRLRLARNLINNKWVIWSFVWVKEQDNLKKLFKNIFPEYEINDVIWQKTLEWAEWKMKWNYWFRNDHDYFFFLNNKIYLKKFYKSVSTRKWKPANPDKDKRWLWYSWRTKVNNYEDNSEYSFIVYVLKPEINKIVDESYKNKILIHNFSEINYPVYVSKQDDIIFEEKYSNFIIRKHKNKFEFTIDEFISLYKDWRFYFWKKGDAWFTAPKIFVHENVEYKVWDVIDIVSQSEAYDEIDKLDFWLSKDEIKKRTPKPEKLIYFLLYILPLSDNLVIDFFNWTWTTISVSQKMWIKWIWVELFDDNFNLTVKRLKKVLFWEQWWISKEVNWKWWWFFKYLYLEQYDDWFDENGYLSRLEDNIKKLENMDIEQNSINDLLVVLEDVKTKVIGE